MWRIQRGAARYRRARGGRVWTLGRRASRVPAPHRAFASLSLPFMTPPTSSFPPPPATRYRAGLRRDGMLHPAAESERREHEYLVQIATVLCATLPAEDYGCEGAAHMLSDGGGPGARAHRCQFLRPRLSLLPAHRYAERGRRGGRRRGRRRGGGGGGARTAGGPVGVAVYEKEVAAAQAAVAEAAVAAEAGPGWRPCRRRRRLAAELRSADEPSAGAGLPEYTAEVTDVRTPNSRRVLHLRAAGNRRGDSWNLSRRFRSLRGCTGCLSRPTHSRCAGCSCPRRTSRSARRPLGRQAAVAAANRQVPAALSAPAAVRPCPARCASF